MLHVRVQPKAKRDAVICGPDGRVRVALTAPPVDGAANAALREVLARHLGIPRSHIVLERGEKSREKIVRLRNTKAHEVQQRLGVHGD